MPKDSFPVAEEIKPASPVLEVPVGTLDSLSDRVGLKSEYHSSSLAMDCGCEQSVTVDNNLRILKELVPQRVLSGGSQGPKVDSSLMRSDCSVEGHILTVPGFGAGSLLASSTYGGSNVEEEPLNAVASTAVILLTCSGVVYCYLMLNLTGVLRPIFVMTYTWANACCGT
ncbi:hypothetical protein Nepgr_033637 [Nepenthes gracilis]|uniref:Uncharacterized protein n=1 Tax=Nepenthes gracilis TaxID=150966 RepID=A0AAD3TMN3_NEPGR|nr:hypothetical protein Nepgr_033637 [Nepenthes gracilis]